MDEFAKTPCSQAVEYWRSSGVGFKAATQMTKAEFDKAVVGGEFKEGPMIDTFGDGRLEPYRPHRQAFGVLRSGACVWAWVRGSHAEEKRP